MMGCCMKVDKMLSECRVYVSSAYPEALLAVSEAIRTSYYTEDVYAVFMKGVSCLDGWCLNNMWIVGWCPEEGV